MLDLELSVRPSTNTYRLANHSSILFKKNQKIISISLLRNGDYFLLSKNGGYPRTPIHSISFQKETEPKENSTFPHSPLTTSTSVTTRESSNTFGYPLAAPDVLHRKGLKLGFCRTANPHPFWYRGTTRWYCFIAMPLTIDASFINAQPYKKILANPEGAQA